MVATLNICSKCGACALIWPIPLKYMKLSAPQKNDIASDAQDIPGFSGYGARVVVSFMWQKYTVDTSLIIVIYVMFF